MINTIIIFEVGIRTKLTFKYWYVGEDKLQNKINFLNIAFWQFISNDILLIHEYLFPDIP